MDDLKARLADTLSRRGPDCSGELTIEMTTTMTMGDTEHHLQCQQLWLYGSVLHIQGELVAQQPYRDRLGNALLWNGEVFGGLTLTDSERSRCCSDTVLVSDRLCAMSARLAEEAGDAAASTTTITCEYINACLVEVLSAIEGPYSFIFFHAATGSLHFGRDPFGRRSLLLLTRRRTTMTARREDHPNYSLQINDHADDDYSTSQVESLSEGEALDDVDMDDILCIASCSVSLPSATTDEEFNSASGGGGGSSIRCVWREVGVRGVYCWMPSPPPAVLRRDRETRQLRRLLHLSPWPVGRLTLMRNHCFSTGLFPHPPVDEVSPSAAAVELLERLTDSIRKRVRSIMHRGGGGGGLHASSAAAVGGMVETGCADDPSPLPCNSGSSSPVGVLFSGGIDSVLLAALLHRVLSDYDYDYDCEEEEGILLPGRNTAALAIDLINVTFDKPRPLIGDQSSPGGGTVSPDRAASVAALSELQASTTLLTD
jgi:hypothetical protein